MEHLRCRIGVIVVLIGLLCLNGVAYGFFTAVDRRSIENTQQGLLNNNLKIDKVNTDLSALSGNVLSMNNEISALSGNMVSLKVQLENKIEAFNDAQVALTAKITGLDKSVNAGRDINQNRKNDVGIFYAVIGIMGLIILLQNYYDKKRDTELLKYEQEKNKEYKKRLFDKEEKNG